MGVPTGRDFLEEYLIIGSGKNCRVIEVPITTSHDIDGAIVQWLYANTGKDCIPGMRILNASVFVGGIGSVSDYADDVLPVPEEIIERMYAMQDEDWDQPAALVPVDLPSVHPEAYRKLVTILRRRNLPAIPAGPSLAVFECGEGYGVVGDVWRRSEDVEARWASFAGLGASKPNLLDSLVRAHQAAVHAARQQLASLRAAGPQWVVTEGEGGRPISTMLDVCGFAKIEFSGQKNRALPQQFKKLGVRHWTGTAGVINLPGGGRAYMGRGWPTGLTLGFFDIIGGPESQYMSIQAAAHHAALEVLAKDGWLKGAHVATRID